MRRSRPPHRTLGLGSLVIQVASLAACDAAPSPDDASTLTVLYPGDERILGPYYEMPAKFLVFLPLVTLDENGDYRGRLAAGWEHSPDYRHWTIRLRDDVRWHDGTPFTAHDVKFTLDLLRHPEILWEPPDAYDVRVLDDTTLTITDRTGCGLDPLDTYRVYYPKHLLEGLDPAGWASWDYWIQPVGNGPFRYARHVPKTMLELEANPDYFAGRPRIDRVVLKFGESSVVELLSGNVDVAGWVVPEDVRRLRREERFQSYWERSAPRAILWNAGNLLFVDARVRRALTHAIDRRALHGLLEFPEGLPLFDGPVTTRQIRRGLLPEPLAYDPGLADSLLTEAGWRLVNGVRVRDGREFRFELLVPEEVGGAGVFIEDQLRRVGVRSEVLIQPVPMIRRLWREGGDFDAMIEFVGEERMGPFFGDESRLGWRHPRAVEILREIPCTFDPETRDRLHGELLEIFRAEQPATYLFPMVYWFVVDRRLQGLSSPWRADPLVNIEHLWLEQEGP